MAGPARHHLAGQAQALHRVGDDRPRLGVGERGRVHVLQHVVERRAEAARDLERLRVDPAPQRLDLLGREIAQLDREVHLAGDHIRRSGLDDQPAHGAHLAPRYRPHDAIHGQRQLGRRQ